MEVVCESPADQRGIPVWNVSRCLNPTDENSQTIRPGMMSQPALISLIVVLCALVLVICVLSVLYHRKRERKLLLSIQPSVEELEGADLVQPDHRAMVKAVFCGQKWKRTNKRLKSKQDQPIKESERVSHIYQIYSPGIDQMREISPRARSAGPVLSRAEDFCQREKTQTEEQEDPEMKVLKGKRSFAGCTKTDTEEKENPKLNQKMTEAKRGKEECGREEGGKRAGMTELKKEHPKLERVHDDDDDADDDHNESNTTFKTNVEYKQTLIMEDKKNDKDTSKENGSFLHDSLDFMLNDKAFQEKTSSFTRHQFPKESSDDTDQPLEDAENVPYLTIGADTEKQSTKAEEICAQVSTEEMNRRPIVRVQTWPPTAAQWKKQWAQHQHVLHVFPNLIFVTQYMHQISIFPSSNPGIPPQGSGLGLLPLPPVMVTDVKPVNASRELCQSDVQSYIQDFSSGRSEDDPELNEQSDTNSNPLLENAAPSDLVSSRTLFKGMTSSADEGRLISNKDSLTIHTSSRQKRTNQMPKRQTTSKSANQPTRRERDRRQVQGDKPRSQTRSEFSSSVPPSGGSPNDDNLLVGNEYTLDLLHEVVENHGRWTRERWRQVHMNKPKKHLAKTH